MNTITFEKTDSTYEEPRYGQTTRWRGKCKFCGKDVFPGINNEYETEKDPLKILNFVACNTCADLREKRRSLEEKVFKECFLLLQKRKKKSAQSDVEAAKNILRPLTQSYCKLIVDWHNMRGIIWEETMVDMLVENPGNCRNLLRDIWHAFRAQQLKPTNPL